MDLTPIYARVADLVHAAPTDVAVTDAVDGAARFVARTCGLVTVDGVTGESTVDPTLIPDEADYREGLVGFARAWYLDVFASRGAQVAIGDNVVDTVFTPEDVWRHWRHYFSDLTRSYGIA